MNGQRSTKEFTPFPMQHKCEVYLTEMNNLKIIYEIASGFLHCPTQSQSLIEPKVRDTRPPLITATAACVLDPPNDYI